MEWPVQDHCWDAFDCVTSTHYVSPLPAYDEDHISIDLNEYYKKLCGAIVQVHFALVHYFIKQDQKLVFTAITRKIVVVRPPLAAPVNPLKRGCLTDSLLKNHASKKKCYVRLCYCASFSTLTNNFYSNLSRVVRVCFMFAKKGQVYSLKSYAVQRDTIVQYSGLNQCFFMKGWKKFAMIQNASTDFIRGGTS